MRNCSPSEYGRALSATRAEVRPELRRHVDIVRPAQEDVLRLLIEPREPAQHVADVGADAEVVELPRVDGDSHYADYGGLRR